MTGRAARARILEEEMDSAVATEGRRTRLAEQRKALPDGPGVYLFRDAKGKVIYVGKAKSMQQARGQPLLQPGHARRLRDGRRDRGGRVRARRLRGRGAAGRAELHQAVPPALQHPPARRQVLSVHRDLDGRGVPARLLHARAPPPRPRVLRALLERQARARHARPAGQGLPVPLLPGRRAGAALGLAVPGLLHQALRGALRRLRHARGVPRVDRRRRGLPVRALPRDRARPRGADEGGVGRAGATSRRRSSATACAPCARCSSASAWPTSRSGRVDVVAVAVDGTDANAQVFQIRDGVLSDRQSFYLENAVERDVGEVAEEFLLQYYGDQMAIPPQIIVQEDVDRPRRAGRGARAAPRGQGRGARRRARRQAPDPRAGRAQRAAGARPGAPEGRAPPPAARRGARRPAGGAGARRAAAAHRVLRHLQPDGDPHGRLDGRLRGRRAEEVRLPALQRPRPGGGRARRLRRDGGGPRPPPGAVGDPAGPQPARPQAQRVVRHAAQPRSSSTAGRASSRRACARWRASVERGVDGHLAGQAHRGGLRARPRASRSSCRTTRPSCSSCSACATRPTASPSPTTARAATAR